MLNSSADDADMLRDGDTLFTAYAKDYADAAEAQQNAEDDAEAQARIRFGEGRPNAARNAR